MNIGLTITICRHITEDIKYTNLLAHLDKLIDALTNSMNQQNENTQKAVSEEKANLLSIINRSSFDTLPKTWQTSLKELGVESLLGAHLYRSIEETFKDNQSTPTDIKEYLQEIRQDINNFHEGANQILSGAEALNLKERSSQPGQAEVSALMPLSALNGELGEFAKATNELDETIEYLSSVATGRREKPTIRQLSNIEPLVVVGAAASTVLLVIKVIKGIQEIIANQYKLRDLKLQAETSGALAAITKSIQAQIDSDQKKQIVDLAAKLAKEYEGIGGTKGEVKTGLKKQIIQLASKIDIGFQIDADMGEPLAPDEENDEAQEAYEKETEMQQQITSIASEVRQIASPETPILNLPAPEEEEEEDEDPTDE